MTPKISVILPVYNSGKHIRQCLDSIAAQTWSEWECICIDDGSGDDSPGILDEYAERDSRFRAIHQKNTGVAGARNAALSMVTGDWVTFVDSDDILHERWMEVASNIMYRESPDLIRLDYLCGMKSADQIGKVAREESYLTYIGCDARKQLWKVLPTKGFLWLCFINASLIKGLFFRDVINCKEDSIWLLELIPRVNCFVQSKFKGYGYRITPGSLVRRKRRVSQSKAYIEAIKDIWDAQHQRAHAEGYLDEMRAMMRTVVEGDVLEWALCSRKPYDLHPRSILDAYKTIKSSGALNAPYGGRYRYYFGLLLWRYTGCLWLVRIVGTVFLVMRKIVSLNKHG